jgi:hypothetical protein
MPKSYELREPLRTKGLTSHKVVKNLEEQRQAYEDKETATWQDAVSPGYAVSLE